MANEVRIPVPWGHIAGKMYGDATLPKLLLFHGLMDNASSFDRLLPLLSNDHAHFCYVTLDLPGHGYSSHFPPHLPIHTYNYLIGYKLVFDHFKQDKYVVIGHSYGGQVALIFAQLYPHLVEKLVMLDTINLFPVHPKTFGDMLISRIEDFLELDQKMSNGGTPPNYTYEQALDRLQNNRRYSTITLDAAKALMRRAVLPSNGQKSKQQAESSNRTLPSSGQTSKAENEVLPSSGQNKFYFTLDPRLKLTMNPTKDIRYTLDTLKYYPVKCPVLIILAKGTGAQQVFFQPILKKFRNLKNFTIKEVDGSHDVHNDFPERVAPSIVEFLNRKIGVRAKL